MSFFGFIQNDQTTFISKTFHHINVYYICINAPTPLSKLPSQYIQYASASMSVSSKTSSESTWVLNDVIQAIQSFLKAEKDKKYVYLKEALFST